MKLIKSVSVDIISAFCKDRNKKYSVDSSSFTMFVPMRRTYYRIED